MTKWTRTTRTKRTERQRRLPYVVLFAAALLAALSFPAVNQARGGAPKQRPSKLDRVLRKAAAAGDSSPLRVIVRTRPGRSASVGERLARHGDRIEANHRRLESLTALVHGDDLLALEADPDVEALSIDAVISADRAVQSDDDSDSQLENVLVSALGLSDTAYNGDKVGIAVIDSGLERSGDLSGGRADRFFDFTADGKAGHPYDDYGHGTHVATLIAGKGKDSENDVEQFNNGRWQRSKLALYRGIAPKARIISLKVLDGNGAGFTSSVLRALEFAIENKDKLNIDIINLSLGHPVYESPGTDPLVRAVEDAARAGIVVVTSAGNYGRNQETGRLATPASRHPATPHRRSRSARWIRTTRSIEATIPSRLTARAGRHGIQAWRNRTSSRPGIVWWRWAHTTALCTSDTRSDVSWGGTATRKRGTCA